MKKPIIHILSFVTLSALSAMPAAAQAGGGKGKVETKKVETKKVVVADASSVSSAFTDAKAAFGKGDNAAAAKSIRSASAMIGDQVKAGDEEHVEALAKSALELESLATNVEKGAIKKESTLDNDFASAHNALANYYSGRAERELAAGNKVGAGNAMNAVANNIESGAKWAGHTLTEGGKKSVGLLRATGGTLISGAGSGVELAGGVLKGGLSVITKIGSKIKGGKELGDEKVTDKTQAVTGGAVEKTGETAEKAGEAVKKGGGLIKKVGDAVKGEGKEEAAPEAE